jgi:hypothetical protein
VDEKLDDLIFAGAVLRAIRSCPRSGSWVPIAAVIATEIRLRVRVSSCRVRVQLSPNV